MGEVVSMFRDVAEIGRDGLTDVLALMCSRCERDIVYIRARGDGSVEFVTRWQGCDCKPERERFGVTEAAEILFRRRDQERGVHVEGWGHRD